MAPTGGTTFDSGRLLRQAQIMAPVENPVLTALGLPSQGSILSVGCGNGAREVLFPGFGSGLDVDGLEVDSQRLAEATSVLRHTWHADATHPEWPCDGRRYDASFSRLVLRHLARPERVVQHMARLTKPGGVVALVGADDASLQLHPALPHLSQTLHALKAHLVTQDPDVDPDVGTRLPQLLRHAGLVDLRTATATLRTARSGSPTSSEAGRDDFLCVIDFLRCRESPEQVAQTEAWLANPHASGSWNLLIATGRVP